MTAIGIPQVRGAMSKEFEIKLEIPTSAVDKVMRLPWLWELASGELRASRLESTYYDTPSFALRERGVTLRVRRAGAKCLQTLKAAANGLAVPIERDEWEEEIPSEEPEVKLLAGTPLAHISRKKLRRSLHPVFDIHADRSAFPIQSANSAIEIAIDRARVTGPEGNASFCEIELELKRGASSELARIARRIASEIPAALSLKTKADRGFALLDGGPATARLPEPVHLSPAARVGEAFQVIGWSCLRHIVLNLEAVAIGDTQAVRQARLGLRRLRAAMSVFMRMLDGPETDAVKAELDWLADELGPARELDVFIERTLRPLLSGQSDPGALNALCEDATVRRSAAMECAKTAVSSERCRQLVLRTALWLVAAEWSDKAELGREQPDRRVGPFAAQALSALSRSALAELGAFGSLDAAGRRKLRVRLRTLRYAAEFFADVVPSTGARRKLLSILKKLLDDLGRLSDFAAHERLRDRFMASWADAEPDAMTAQKAFALGFVLGQQQQEKEARSASVQRWGALLTRLA